MYLKGSVGGLKPNTSYSVQFEIALATNVPQGCFGVGGAPGESVHVIAGTTGFEPQRVIVDVGGLPWYWMNIEFPGKDALVLGNVANSRTNCQGTDYEIKTLQNPVGSLSVRTDERGSAWLIVGTGSGFEGKSSFYYTQVKATFRGQ